MSDFEARWARWTSGVALLDGATGTELDRRGVDIALPLWSARALLEAPDEVEAVHRDYFLAGAGAVTTATFRTHERSLAKAGLGHEARRLTAVAVERARRARDAAQPEGLVFGSVAPLEDCYRPERTPEADACRREHAALVDHLLEAGADGVLIETMSTAREACAAMEAARRAASGRWMIGVIASEPGRLLGGDAMRDVLAHADGARAIGVNCVAAPELEAHVRWLREHGPAGVPILAYANVGRAADDGSWISSDAVEPARYAAYAERWVAAGASIVGGCCGTRPATIAEIARGLAG